VSPYLQSAMHLHVHIMDEEYPISPPAPPQHAAELCITLQAQGNTLQHTAAHCNTMRHAASTLQHHTTHCNTLQHTTTHCNTLQHTATHRKHTASTLQHTATHCNTLQHTATHCNTLQHTAHALHAHVLSRPVGDTTDGGDRTRNIYDCPNFQHVFTGVPVYIKRVFLGVPEISNWFSRE